MGWIHVLEVREVLFLERISFRVPELHVEGHITDLADAGESLGIAARLLHIVAGWGRLDEVARLAIHAVLAGELVVPLVHGVADDVSVAEVAPHEAVTLIGSDEATDLPQGGEEYPHVVVGRRVLHQQYRCALDVLGSREPDQTLIVDAVVLEPCSDRGKPYPLSPALVSEHQLGISLAAGDAVHLEVR